MLDQNSFDVLLQGMSPKVIVCAQSSDCGSKKLRWLIEDRGVLECSVLDGLAKIVLKHSTMTFGWVAYDDVP